MKLLREPGTGTVSDTSDEPNRAVSITRCVPRLGRSRTSGSSSPAQTPVALITARADTSNSSPVSVSRRRTPAPVACVASTRVRTDAPYPAAVRATATTSRASSMSCPSQPWIAPRRCSARSAGASRSASPRADPARRIEHRGRRADEAAQAVAHAVAGGDDRAARPVVGRVERDHLRERAGQMRGDPGEQQVPLGGALVRDAELTRRQVAQSAVDELRAPPARAVGEVVAFDEDGAQAAARGIQCQPDPGDAAADHDDVDDRVVGERRELPSASVGVQRRGGGRAPEDPRGHGAPPR